MASRSDQYFAKDRDAPRTTRVCAHPGCGEPGEYRAPKSRDRLDEYHWFCLEHVRAYNAQWNYYAGLDDEDVEEAVRADICWGRPTWRLGGGTARAFARAARGGFRDDFKVFADQSEDADVEHVPPAERPAIRRSLRVLDLDWPATFDDVRIRYKELVKQLHPDANGGDTHAEERLKRVNQAYSVLKTSALARPPPAAATA